MTLPPRFEITEDQIDWVVFRFYARMRAHPVLGPIFNGHVHDWARHEAKIAGFWRNAIMFERSYDGNPMMAHKAAGDVRPEHFALWLAVFDDVVHTELQPEAATAWSALAHRIGRGLRMGLEDQGAGGPPRLG